MLENGAYDENWAQIHAFPEQTAQIASQLQDKALLPIHWAKFDLAYHPWQEPMQRLYATSQGRNYVLVTPKIGEVFDLQNPPQKRWWEDAK